MIEYVCNISSLLLKTARIVHEVIAILPQETIDTYEREELDWEPRSKSKNTWKCCVVLRVYFPLNANCIFNNKCACMHLCKFFFFLYMK